MEQTRQSLQRSFSVFSPPQQIAESIVGVATPVRADENADDVIARSARNAIHDDPSVNEQPVYCHTTDGVVTLSGSVAWFYQRAQCDLAVRYLNGVRRVVNKIQVIPVANATEIQQRMKHAELEQARTRALL